MGLIHLASAARTSYYVRYCFAVDSLDVAAGLIASLLKACWLEGLEMFSTKFRGTALEVSTTLRDAASRTHQLIPCPSAVEDSRRMRLS